MGVRLALLNFGLRSVIKNLLWLAADPVKLRNGFAAITRYTLRPPPYTRLLKTTLTGSNRSVPALWVQHKTPKYESIILYFHGGGYIAGSSKTHTPLLATLAEMTGLRVCMPDYRLAPEHQFPAAVDDALLSYKAILAAGYRPGQIIFGGESAGGGLMLSLLHNIAALDLPMPVAAFALSPWTDLTFTGKSLASNKAADPVFPAHRIVELGEVYLGGNHSMNPLASPLFGEFKAAPPILIQVGSTEILRDDSERMAEVMRGMGVDVELDVWENAPHFWQMHHGNLPEADQALQKIAVFIGKFAT